MTRKTPPLLRLILKPAHLTVAVILSFLAGVLLVGAVFAHDNIVPATQGSPLHPSFALLDMEGQNVLDSGQAVSTMQTCGQCHDTQFIASHNFHAPQIHPGLPHFLQHLASRLIIANFSDGQEFKIRAEKRLDVVGDDMEFTIIPAIQEPSAAAFLPA